MKIKAEFPFDGYIGYVRICNHGKSKGRRLIGFYAANKNPKRLTMSYARYLVSVREKRILSKIEQVDHIDGDSTNDYPDNLQILSSSENNKKRIEQSGKSSMMVELKCPSCETFFIKERRQSFLSKGGFYSTCSKECGYKMLSIKKNLTKDQIILIGKKQIIREYRLKESET